tara:strand:- start:1471 stop:1599 length:129 start_codon:yes stop_codon:yes gene_type:complete
MATIPFVIAHGSVSHQLLTMNHGNVIGVDSQAAAERSLPATP